MMKTSLKMLLLSLMLLAPFVAGAQLPQASLMLQWTPQAQFAGYLMAQEKGFYRQQGVDLTIIYGGPDRMVSKYLADGRADFGMLFLATALARRDNGLPLINIGQMVPRSTLMLIARSDNGIETIQDLNGKKVSLWANEFQIQPRLLFEQEGIRVEVIPQASSLELFLRGAVSATSAMWYNEYHSLLSSGLRSQELKPFFFRDTAYDFPEDGIYCLPETLKTRPQLAKAVLAASLEGWRYAFSHKEETLDVVIRRMTEAKLPVNRVHQRWMLERMHDTLSEALDVGNLGILDPEVFERVMNQLLEAGLIHRRIEYSSFFRGETP